MNRDTLKETIRKELPALLREDPALRAFLQDLMSEQYAGRQETDDKFERLLGELRREREALTRKWDEQDRRWEQQDRKWQQQDHRLQKQDRKWDAKNRKLDQQNRKWDEQTALLKDFMAEQKHLWQRMLPNGNADGRRTSASSTGCTKRLRRWPKGMIGPSGHWDGGGQFSPKPLSTMPWRGSSSVISTSRSCVWTILTTKARCSGDPSKSSLL
jgi:hypothetical protein